MVESEVACIRRQIELACEAMKLAIEGFAVVASPPIPPWKCQLPLLARKVGLLRDVAQFSSTSYTM